MATVDTQHQKLAAIMFTDMVGYSAVAQRSEALALELLDEQRRILRDILPRHQGHEIKSMGDGNLVEFASALAATQCAVEIQKAVADWNQSALAERRFLLRIGIHVGDVLHRENDVLGDGVNIAARVEPLAEPGGICLTQQVVDQIQHRIAELLVAGGKVKLKNISKPVAIYRVDLSGVTPAPAPAPAAAEKKSVAVLPFVNMSADRENEFLSDGITEDLITALSQVKDLRVPARTSSFAVKEKREDIRRIGEQLSVSTVLEGSVRKAGTKLRITAQLINVSDGFHLWSARFDREMNDVFAIQDEITRAIVAALKLHLVGDDDAPLVRRQTRSAEAYELYLKGRFHWNQRGTGLLKGLHYFELALLEDSNFALAHSGVADAYNLLGFYGYAPPADTSRKTRAAVDKALALDPELAEAQTSAAFIIGTRDFDFEGAERSYRSALELNPGYIPARLWFSTQLSAVGKHDEALAQARQAIELDPLAPLAHTIHGWNLLHARRLEEAAGALNRALELAPNFVLAHWLLGQAHGAADDFTKAVPALEKAMELAGGAAWVAAYLGHALAAAGRWDRALELLTNLQDAKKQPYVRAFGVAVVHAGLGDKDQALAWLRRALDERDVWLVWTRWNPAFKGLHDDPTFAHLLQQIGLPA